MGLTAFFLLSFFFVYYLIYLFFIPFHFIFFFFLSFLTHYHVSSSVSVPSNVLTVGITPPKLYLTPETGGGR